VGADADLVIWQPEKAQLIRQEDILFRHKISPYIGQTLYGVVQETIVNGATVYKNQTIEHKNQGKWLLRK
jgi:allantoinase